MTGMVQKWARVDPAYQESTKPDSQGRSPEPMTFFWAIWDLLERNHFFERQDKVDLIG